MNWSRSTGLGHTRWRAAYSCAEPSSSADEVVSTTTGMWHRSASDLICSSSWRPSYFGRFRSSRIRSGRGRRGTRRAGRGSPGPPRRRAPRAGGVVEFVVLERFPGDQLVTGVVLDEQDVDRATGIGHGAVPSSWAGWASGVAVATMGRVKRKRVPPL